MNTTSNRLLRLTCGVTLLLLALAWAPASARAASAGEASPVSEDAVRAAVETFVRYVTADARPDAVVERMEPYQVKDQTVAYIADLQGGGFCLAAADDRLLPVYLYSPQGTYDPASLNYRFVLNEIARRQQALQDRSFTLAPNQLTDRVATWDDLIAGRVPQNPNAPASPVSMVLPLTSQWHQGSPYNDQCPTLTPGSDEHVAVGCVATATAQIMYYWKWPPTGTGSDSVTYVRRYRTAWDNSVYLASNPGIPDGWAGRLEYDAVNHLLYMNGYWDFGLYTAAQGINSDQLYKGALAVLWSNMYPDDIPLTVDMGAAIYNWESMADTNNDSSPGAGEVAKISYHTAVGVHMYFTVAGSTANGGGARSALVDHFRYAPTVLSHEPPVASILVSEMQWLRPVWLGGGDPNIGVHAWVAYGYNTETNPTQFLMNFGWGGTDGWYSLDQSFPVGQADITYIAPLHVKFVGTRGSGDGSPPTPYGGIEAALASGFSNGTLIFQADSDNTFSAATLTIDRPLILKGQNATIR